jgi:hypothetical protein
LDAVALLADLGDIQFLAVGGFQATDKGLEGFRVSQLKTQHRSHAKAVKSRATLEIQPRFVGECLDRPALQFGGECTQQARTIGILGVQAGSQGIKLRQLRG